MGKPPYHHPVQKRESDIFFVKMDSTFEKPYYIG